MVGGVQPKILLTQEGLDSLSKELQELENVKRPATVERLAKAREEGDLSENSNYSQSREELAFIDGRIEELKELVGRAAILSVDHELCEEVQLGCRVTVKTSRQKDGHVFHLVGEWEADPSTRKISHKSPLGMALLGKKVGDQVEVDAPAGKVIYQIVRIE